jgi:N-acetylneuraminate synthase/N,N'-diacetyllegionaminate synthase
MSNKVIIGPNQVGDAFPCFIIAEGGVNHNGNLETALQLVEAAAQAGANAIKFQTFKAERVITRVAPKADYQKVTTDPTESQFEMLRKLELQPNDCRIIQQRTTELDIVFFSTPYSVADAQFLLELGVPAFKIASIDIVNYPLLRTLAQWGKPMILSSGMATLGEIEQGINTVRMVGNEQIILLQCTTNYPIQDTEVNLRVMDTLRCAFGVPVGFSDHTVGWEIPLAAVALGAIVIEKHFTLNRSSSGPDHAASLEPAEFAQMVHGIRRVEQALGTVQKQPLPVELENRKAMRRSLVAAVNIPAGTVISEDMLTMKRPGTGFGAEAIDLFVGRKARGQIEADTILTLEMVSS